MKTKLKLVLAFVVLSLAIGYPLAAQGDPPARKHGIFLVTGIVDCCENAGSPSAYCCRNCCWLFSDCDSDEECGPE